MRSQDQVIFLFPGLLNFYDAKLAQAKHFFRHFFRSPSFLGLDLTFPNTNFITSRLELDLWNILPKFGNGNSRIEPVKDLVLFRQVRLDLSTTI